MNSHEFEDAISCDFHIKNSTFLNDFYVIQVIMPTGLRSLLLILLAFYVLKMVLQLHPQLDFQRVPCPVETDNRQGSSFGQDLDWTGLEPK